MKRQKWAEPQKSGKSFADMNAGKKCNSTFWRYLCNYVCASYFSPGEWLMPWVMEKLKRRANLIRSKCLVACSLCHKTPVLTFKDGLLLRGKTRFSYTLTEQMPEAREGEVNLSLLRALTQPHLPQLGVNLRSWGWEAPRSSDPFWWKMLWTDSPEIFPRCPSGRPNFFRPQFSHLWNGFLNVFPLHPPRLVVKLKTLWDLRLLEGVGEY